MKKISLYFLAVTILFGSDMTIAETAMEQLVTQIVDAEDSNDSKMYEIEKWVIENIQYTSDKKQFNMMERWTLPYETLQRRRGDCEDGATLLIALAATAGVPTERLRLYAPIRIPHGWHACVAYQRESDDGWVWMEWTHEFSGPLVEERRIIGDVPRYAPYGTYFKVTSLNPFHMEICRPQ